MDSTRKFQNRDNFRLVFKKIDGKDKTKYDNLYSSSKVEMINNEIGTE